RFSSPLTSRPILSTLFPYTTLFRSYFWNGRDVIAPVLQPRIDRLALQGQYPENALVDPSQWFLADESLQPLDTESERAQGEGPRSEEHTSELQSRSDLVCRLLLEKK